MTEVTFPGLGLQFTINRVAFSIGNFSVYWYGVILATGLLLAVLYAFRHCPEYGIDPDAMIDVILIGTILAIVCARIYYVAMAPFQYDTIWQMMDIRQGGIAIYGALIGAFVFGGLACRWRKVPVFAMFDLTALGFLIGQGIGRWGNFVNQEAFGCNTTLPWGMYSAATEAYLRSGSVTVPKGMTVDPTMPVHPTFLYESIWCLLGFFLLAAYARKRKFNGDVALRYAIWYGLGRFAIEGVRTDSLMLIPELGIRASQVVAVVTVIVALVLELVLTRRYKGKPLMVQVAMSKENRTRLERCKKEGKQLPDGIEPPSYRAGMSNREFVDHTAAYNKALEKSLDEALKS